MMTQSTNTLMYTSSYTSSYTAGAASDEDDIFVTEEEDATALGKNDFLKLLFAQLQNQDPLDPADNTEFIAQLAQFSSLEQMTSMNENLEKMLESNNAIASAVSNAMIINYFGKSVTAETSAFVYDGENEAQITFELDDDIVEGTVVISDESQNIIDVRSISSLEAGQYSFTWDGVNVLGVQSDPGIYTVTVEAYNSADEVVGVTPLYSGTVQGVSYLDGETLLDIDGILVPFANVRSIVDGVEI